ncbi:RimJ/RimL family protein N-acetyltransferase [Kitasatospora sp. SolWspMP-SS2h]|uniref:GNAT family N-acetyltransferase n=1 Tax=Kitasatospora sp. SolWspMP-SS2h TaxID=1305729 RepID=UPI000DC052C2|nr:GNAT family N-acetyltransferase [Kitasatospora sp. SolWspMP-SS2h]RAJ40154.1 RimJ/RimL family protein N-acetyltransferase [Kitasatospora sp. SolWspMP-SS2h]
MELPRTMPELPAAHGFRLRRWSPDDTGLIREASTDPYIPLITTVPAPYTGAGAAAFVERQWRRTEIGTGYPFVIVDPAGRAVGNVGLWVGELPLRGWATVGYWVAAPARGRGAAKVALDAVVGWALDELGVPGLELFVEPWNAASIRTAERAGFRCTGLRPAHQVVDGRPRDMWRYVRP